MLTLPAKLLRSKKSAADPIAALDLAIKALEREVARLKIVPQRGIPRPVGALALNLASSPFWSESLPTDRDSEKESASALREAVAEHYAPLLYYLRREIGRAESEGWAPRGTIDAEAVADEVTCQAFAQRDSKPPEQSHRVWLYALARRELQRRFREFEDQSRTSVSLESEPVVTDAEVDNEPLVMAEGPLHGDAIELSDLTPDTHSLSPDAEAADHDLTEYLRTLSRAWPREERAVFELHFLEGFEADEVAMLEKLEMERVKELIDVVQQRLRQALTEAVQAKAVAGVRAPSLAAAGVPR
jgi:DNA-directed RNA polymerase specialized sigma24 family protein